MWEEVYTRQSQLCHNPFPNVQGIPETLSNFYRVFKNDEIDLGHVVVYSTF